jgi:glutamate-5-semialdehyde dehydrogenase
MNNINNKEINNHIENICFKAHNASKALSHASTHSKNKALEIIATYLKKDKKEILEANIIDMSMAKKNNVSQSLLDRLFLDKNRIDNMIDSMHNIISLEDPIGSEIKRWKPTNGIDISQTRVPIGVIGIIYESRPNVTADASALALKSGNSIILRGGSESFYSSSAIVTSIKNGLKESKISEDCVHMVNTINRDAVGLLLNMHKYVNLIIPRGGKALIERVQIESKIPVLSHLDGLCHTYIDVDANKDMALNIVLNAKMRRTGVCGATETVLCHKDVINTILPEIINKLLEQGCEIRGDKNIQALNKNIKNATIEDWQTEYLDKILSIKTVKNVSDAVMHIEKFGSNHTDAIITDNKNTAEIFLKEVNSAIVLHNASTQYADGGEFGMGAEMGIATGKLHARGPVGLEQLTTYKYQLRGTGQVRP